MSRIPPSLLFATALAAPQTLGACGDEQRLPILLNTFEEVVDYGGVHAPIVERDEVVSSESYAETTGGDEVYWCTRTTHDVTAGFESFPTFDPNSEVVFPGNLLQGATLDAATPSPIPVARGGGTIVMTLVNGSTDVVRTLPTVGLGTIVQAMNEIISTANPDLPARTSYSMTRVSSREQLALAMNASLKNLTGEVEASFGYESDVTYNRLLVKLTQSYYTIAFELPTDPAQLFAPTVTPADLARFVGPGNPATFISSVTYGRVFYLLVQSTSSYEAMEASIAASFQAAVVGGELDGEVGYVSELDSLQVGGYALGGDSALALSALQGDFADLVTFIADGGTITTGTPLSYVVRSVAKPDQIVSVAVATEYDVVECEPIGSSLDHPIAWFDASSGVETVPTNLGVAAVTGWDNLVDADNPGVVDTGGAPWAGYTVNDAVLFQYDPGNFTGNLRFAGGDLAGQEYTLFLVASASINPDDFPPVWVVWGNDDRDGAGLFVGFDATQKLRVSHGGSRVLVVDTPHWVQDTHLYTIRYSDTEGLTVWIDGVERAHDPTFVGIDSWTGARFGVIGQESQGSAPGALMNLTDLRIFGVAAAPEQREAIEDDILRTHSL